MPEQDSVPDLTPPSVSVVSDPLAADAVETDYDTVTCASPTSGPNRMTIHVPTELTVLSLGAPSPASAWDTDIGITGYTAHHIHFETKTNDKTIVSLGGPATTTAITGHGGEPPKETQGYSMVTAEHAWHEATGQHYLLSQKADISMRTMGGGMRVVVQAEQGYVDLNGGQEVTLSGAGVAIGAASTIEFENVLYDGHFAGKAPTSTSQKVAKTGMDMIGAAFSAHDLLMKAKKMLPEIKKWEFKSNEYAFFDTIKWLGDAAKFGISVNKIRKVFAGVGSPPGCVKLAAEKDVGGLAGSNVSLSGAMGASMASIASATVVAGLMATLKGTLFAGVSSVFTSIKGQKRVEVGSVKGNVVFNAKQNVELTSDHDLVLAGETDVHVSGNTHLCIGAGQRVWLGGSKEWGVLFSNKAVTFGKASGTAKMASAKNEDEPAIRIDDNKIDIVGKEARVTLSNSLFLVEAPGVRIDAKQKNVTFNGQRAVLDS